MAKFDWNQFPAEKPEAPAKAAAAGKFDWNNYATEGPPKPEPPKGPKVYDAPIGPGAGAVKSFGEAVDRAKVLATQGKQAVYPQGTFPERYPVEGDAPLAIPAGVAPRLAQIAGKIAEGKGLGFAAARTALSAGQGAVMSAAQNRKPGESWQDTIDRAESGAKLSGGIQLAAEAVPYVGKALGAASRKIGAAISGVDENLIKNYAARTDEVNDLIKQSGGDVTVAADQVRTELADGIQKTKQGLSARISKTLEQTAPDVQTPAAPILEKLKAARARLNPNFKASAIRDLDEIIGAIESEAKDGVLSVSSLYQVKQYLNEASAPAYNKGGQIFTRASEAAKAARDAAYEARKMLRPVAPAISEADSQLSKLHAIERRLNKNLLAAGKPDGALLAAGSGANPRNAATLRELERVSGVPASQRAMDLATARTFASPAVLPSDYTGKAVARQAGAALLGTGIGGPVGGAVGAALASPMAVKVGVNALNVARDVAAKVPSFARFTRENPVAAQAVIQLMAGQIRRENAPPEAVEFLEQNPQLMQQPVTPNGRARDVASPKTKTPGRP